MKGWVSFAAAVILLAGIPGCGAVFDPSAVVIAINVTPEPTSARVGSGVTFSAEAIYSDGHTAPVNSDITWTHDSQSLSSPMTSFTDCPETSFTVPHVERGWESNPR